MNEWHYAVAVCAAINGNARPTRQENAARGDSETDSLPADETDRTCASDGASTSASSS